MHALQKKAVLSLLGMIETAAREMRQLLSDGPVESYAELAKPQTASKPMQDQPSAGILSDEEESKLELLMESQREALLRDSQTLAQRFFNDAGVPPPGFFEDDLA